MNHNIHHFIGKISANGFEGIFGEPFESQLDCLRECKTKMLAEENRDGNPPTILAHFIGVAAESKEAAETWANNPDNADYIQILAENRVYEGVRIVGPSENLGRVLILDKTINQA